MEIDKLEAIIKILKQNDVTEFEITNDGTHLKLSRAVLQPGSLQRQVSVAEVQHVIPHSSINGNNPLAPDAAQAADNAVPSHWIKVESPIVGTYYSRPSPDKDPFVNEGKVVKKGDTLCIIEAMKLMNEIEAPATGKIEKVLVQDATVVEYGEALYFINPSN